MAAGICFGTCAGHERNGEAAESVDLESDLDRTEGRGGCAERAAGVRCADAAGIYPVARSRGSRAAVASRCHLHHAGRGLLRVSEYFLLSWPRRAEIRLGCGRQAV